MGAGELARSRNLKPGFFLNEILAECHPLARILFEGLWVIADRAGRMPDRPKKIKAEVLPYDDCDVDDLLNELASKYDDDGSPAFIIRYQADSHRYIQVVHFTEHQNPHIKEAASTIPAPDMNSTSTVQAPEEHRTDPADSLLPLTDSLLLDPDPDQKDMPLAHPAPGPDVLESKPEQQTLIKQSTAKECTPDFEAFYRAYPRQIEKKEAFKAWNQALKKGKSPPMIMLALEHYIAYVRLVKVEWKYPASFLRSDLDEWLNLKEVNASVGSAQHDGDHPGNAAGSAMSDWEKRIYEDSPETTG